MRRVAMDRCTCPSAKCRRSGVRIPRTFIRFRVAVSILSKIVSTAQLVSETANVIDFFNCSVFCSNPVLVSCTKTLEDPFCPSISYQNKIRRDSRFCFVEGTKTLQTWIAHIHWPVTQHLHSNSCHFCQMPKRRAST
jgi:hypothetical protein